jgi:hypothetical protein
MVYNSAQYDYAIKKVRSLTLTLADGSKVTFNNLAQNVDNCNTLKKVMRYGGSVIADFEEVSVKKIEIAVNKADKYNTANTTIRIGDIVVLGRVDGKEKTDFEFRSANDMASEYIVDGIDNDKEWKNKNWYVYDNGAFSVKATATMGKGGVFVTATIYDDYLFHMGAGGHDAKFDGMHRWYKNTNLTTYLYVGDEKTYATNKLKSVRTSAYEVESSSAVTANVSFVGAVNSGNSVSYTVEAFFPYSIYGVTSAQEAYLSFEYVRPLTSDEINPTKYVFGNTDITNFKTLLKVNKDGYVSGFNAQFGNGKAGGSTLGEWADVTKTSVRSTTAEPSKVYINEAYGKDLIATTSIFARKGQQNAKAGLVIKGSTKEKAYLLDFSNSDDGKKLNRIAIYSQVNGRKDLVYDDDGKFASVYLDVTTLKLVKVGGKIALFVNDKFVYAEVDETLSQNVQIGLYSEGSPTTFSAVSYSIDKAQAQKQTKNVYNISAFSHFAISVNAGFINTDKLYLFVLPTHVASYKVSEITLNGNDCTDKMQNNRLLIEYTDKKDAVVSVSAESVSGITVSGKLMIDGFTANNVSIKFVSSNGYVFETFKDKNYSVSLPQGTYTVYVSSQERGCSTTTLNLTAATTLDLAVPSKLMGGKSTVNGVTYTTEGVYAINNAGTIASNKDIGSGKIMFTGVTSDCAVIEFTSECFLNPATLPEGAKYEKDATVGVFFANGTKASTIGYHGTSSRVRTDNAGSWSTCTKEPVSNVLPANLSSYGTVQKFLCIYLDNTWYMYFENGGEYVFAYKYDFVEGESATGECAFGLSIATSYAYTRIRFKDASIVTDKTYVQETLASLQNQE